MVKNCSNCGSMRNEVFTCKRCSLKVCLGCYSFTKHLCFNCEVLVYNEKYKTKIDAYTGNVNVLSVSN